MRAEIDCGTCWGGCSIAAPLLKGITHPCCLGFSYDIASGFITVLSVSKKIDR